MTGCNDLQPGWGAGALGAGFATNRTWGIQGTGGRLSQEWSDAVTAAACDDRTTIVGGVYPNFNADCRNSVGNDAFGGHYFTWCAVMRFADELCPAPWRVPTQQDFINLDMNLGGNGLMRLDIQETFPMGALTLGYWGFTAANSPLSRWGGSRFTRRAENLELFWIEESSYWSSTESTTWTGGAYTLGIQLNNMFPGRGQFGKESGIALRCVRNIECDQLFITDPAAANQTVGSGQTIAPVTINLVQGVGGTATALNIRWTPSAPAGITFNAATRTLSGSTTQSGNFTFEIFTTNHTAPCTEAVFTGTLTVTPTLMTGCNNLQPLFGGVTTGVPLGELGQITWGNSTNTDINATTGTGATTFVSRRGTSPVAGLYNAQIWSGAVFAQGCAKGNIMSSNAFNGGGTGNFNADCRQSLHSLSNRSVARNGDLFSWCAVMRFADVLCPDGWRVPTAEDFRNLHWILTGDTVATGSNVLMDITTSGLYAPTNAQGGTVGTNPAQVGGVWGGARFTGSTSNIENQNSNYWSSSQSTPVLARNLSFTTVNVWPENNTDKNVGFALRCVRDSVIPPPPMTGCNNLTPGWGSGALGAGFASATTWVVTGTGGRTSQEWSDAVTATACAPRPFLVGGTSGNFNADCSNSALNPNFGGHYFTWCAVMRFADQLCPYPWRVPTRQDFVDLDLNLGGTGANRPFVGENTPTGAVTLGFVGSTAANSPQSRWGGARFTGWDAIHVLPESYYWSSTESSSADNAFILSLAVDGLLPQGELNKLMGLALRCVRDWTVEAVGCNLNTPGFGASLGTVSFATSQTWTVLSSGGGRSSQVWSGAVTATACAGRTTQFAGGTFGSVNADCRNSTGTTAFNGHYFTWCAVVRFADELCPYPWRVPTRQDFIDLDLNLGGTGLNRDVGENSPTGAVTLGFTGSTAANSPQSRWGGARFTGQATNVTHPATWYWSSTSAGGTAGAGIVLGYHVASIVPQATSMGYVGGALRCVRDWTVEGAGCNPNHSNWLPSIGTVTWGNRSNSNIEVNTTPITGTGGRLSQVWSAHVFASVCNKGGTAVTINDFNGGTTGNFNADCRRSFHSANNAANPAAHINGDLFSWCAVVEFAEQLCPAPWRVPTEQDFRDLHLNLGWATIPGLGIAVALNTDALRGRYMNPTTGTAADPTIGGTWGGSRFTSNTHVIAHPQSIYWSSTETATGLASALGFNADFVWPVMNNNLSEGVALRCVRN